MAAWCGDLRRGDIEFAHCGMRFRGPLCTQASKAGVLCGLRLQRRWASRWGAQQSSNALHGQGSHVDEGVRLKAASGEEGVETIQHNLWEEEQQRGLVLDILKRRPQCALLASTRAGAQGPPRYTVTKTRPLPNSYASFPIILLAAHALIIKPRLPNYALSITSCLRLPGRVYTLQVLQHDEPHWSV